MEITNLANLRWNLVAEPFQNLLEAINDAKLHCLRFCTGGLFKAEHLRMHTPSRQAQSLQLQAVMIINVLLLLTCCSSTP